MNGQAGKGSSPRPFSVDQKTYADNWERAFGKKPNPALSYGDYCGAPLTQINAEGDRPNPALSPPKEYHCDLCKLMAYRVHPKT